MEPNKKLLLLDAYALIFRAFYAMIRSPRITSTGIDTSAVFGFVNTLQDLLKRQQPSHIAVCFDPPGGTFRHENYEPYKANREKTPEGILQAVPYIKRILEAYRIPIYTVEGYEADDVIGTLSHLAEQQGFFTYMVTADKDFGQLVTPNIKVLNPSKNEILGVEEVNAKYGIQTPRQLIDILGLMGDSADNIPGCPGVGPKNAEKLIQQFGSIENLLEHTDELKGAQQQKVRDNAEQIRMSKWLATIITDVPVTLDADALRREPVDMDALREVVPDVMIEQLSLPYVAVATDWAAGRQAVFRRGSLYDAIRASISLPLFFSPVRRDDALLIDGGVLNPIPLDLVERPQGSLLVGVNVSGPDWGGRKEVKAIAAQHPNRLRSLPMNILSRLRPEGLDVNYYTLVSRMISLMIQQNARQSIRLHRPDIVMEIPMNRFGSFDYDKSEQIVAYGRARMHQALNEWERR